MSFIKSPIQFPLSQQMKTSLCRRLSPSRPSSSHYRQLSSTGSSSSSSSNRRITSFASSRLPPLTKAKKTSSQRKTSSRAKWNVVSTRERSSTVKVKETKSPVKKAKAPVIGPKSRVKTAKLPIKTTIAPVKTSVPTRKRNLKVLSKTSNNLLDSVFDEETKEEEEIKGWVLPPSLMAVAAVPGSPVINAMKLETRVPKDVQETVDPYLQFMPVPAVPLAEAEQAPRKPKESLTSLTLNLNLPNNLDAGAEIKTFKSATSKAPRIKPTKPFTTIAPTSSSESVLSSSVFDEKKDARKKFKRCHGRCVQQFCLPVNDLSVYAKCVDKCKLLCS